ncbi:coiled-coil domain-containing protein 39 [Protopterus annectens]|uniref:coiled-coil domain-containing protein 39 n=1 Tax=Protopterus annectens TaxID=7888 RepID=UPI001CFBF860|nr:coiled-coil domain-containing protein 39 [Protopterus annectens]
MTSEVLAEIKWDEGFAIPVANSENKRLEEDMQKRQKEKANLENRLNEYEDRIHAMAEHLKNVRQELTHTQSLCRAREKETETEEHFKSLSEREMGRLKQEIKRLEHEIISLREKKNMQENNIFRATQKLEDLKCQLKWDQQALEAWLEESARKDDDSVALQKYARQDEGKIKEMTLQIEKLTTDANQKRRLLDSELTETITAQIELDKAAEDFRKAHYERQELIRQWESTIEQMRKRDQEMDHCALLLAEVKQQTREREAVIKEKIHFLESETGNNKEYEKKISVAERQAAKLRLDYQDFESNRSRLQDELEGLKITVDRTATDLEAMRSLVSNLKKEIQEKNSRVKLSKEKNEALTCKLKSVTESALSVEERALRMEEMLKEEEQAVKELETRLSHLRELKFKKEQELHTHKTKEKNVTAEIAGSRTALKNLNNRLQKLDMDSLRQQEILYNQDFQIQQMERRMARMKGDVNIEEKHVLEAKIAELTKTLEEKSDTYNLLSAQHKKLQDDVRYIKKGFDKTVQEKSDLTSKIEELTLFNDMSEKEFKKIRSAKQDLMVEDNILKLEIKRLRDLLYNKADHVLSLEKRKLQLQTAMRERTEEIKIHKEMLQSQVRMADQDRQSISGELHERVSKIDKLRKRFEILMVAMAPPEGEEEKSQAYYVIKAAQEKEELQRTGDDLDAKIRKAEKEIRALENTLQVINACNSSYRKSFIKVTETSEEYEEKLKLEEQKRAVEEKYRFKRKQIRELQDDFRSMSRTLEDLLTDETMYSKSVEEKQSKITHLNKELDNQKQKMERVMKQSSKLAREIRSAKKSKGETHEERDIDLRELRDFNRSVNKLLVDAMERNPDLTTALQIYFQQAGLELPTTVSTPSSRQSSRPTSARSSASSLRTQGSSGSSSSNGSARSATIKTLDLGLDIAVTSAVVTSPSSTSQPGSAASSARSSHSKKSLK